MSTGKRSRSAPPDVAPADFDDTMRRVLGISPGQAREIVERTAPGKPKAEREGAGTKKGVSAKKRSPSSKRGR